MEFPTMFTDLELAQLCSDTYDTGFTITGDSYKSITCGSMALKIVRRDEYSAIGLRGTFNPLGWLMDLDFFRVNHIHTGFNWCWNRVQEAVLSEQRKIYLTGHSLGGAMCTIGAPLIKNLQRVVTFGEPRSGDYWRYKNYTLKVFRYVYNYDPVTHIPLHGFLDWLGSWFRDHAWWHVSDAIWLGRYGSILDAYHTYKKAIPLVKAIIEKDHVTLIRLIVEICQDHQIENYINAQKGQIVLL